jgi:tetratricopeptide (TPR) repeat protein
MDAAKMAEELEKLAEQPELSPELQAELQSLFKKLAEQLGDNPATRNLMNELASLQTQAVSPDMLKEIARALSKMNQTAKSLAQFEQQIKESRKNIAVAEIEMNRESGGGSTPGGGPGEEPGREMEQQVNTSSTPSAQAEGTDLTLASILSDSDKFSQVFVGENDPSSETEPAYLPYRDVLLKAQTAYAEAMKNDRIPVQYQKQVKDYLQAIENP